MIPLRILKRGKTKIPVYTCIKLSRFAIQRTCIKLIANGAVGNAGGLN
jgi:hypothetical protein